MNADNQLRNTVTRRGLLKGLGLSGAALAASSALAGCVVESGGAAASGKGSAADAVTGGFDWKKASGKTIRILQTPHPYQQAFAPLLNDFTKLTGITVVPELVAEADYFTKLNTELAGGAGTHDVFMTGAYFIWQYGPPGWMENLTPWLQNSSATSEDYDFEDIYPGLRLSTRWDFKNASPLGFGGQWAIPWGFETNVIAYNKKLFDARGIKPAETLGNFVQLAHDLTKRSANQYGVAFRGSKSWATIHPGFMTMFSREGAKDYKVVDGKLQASMNSPEAVEFTKVWAELAKTSGPASWTTYDYPNCTTDLGNGVAAMVFDADSATYAKGKPGASKEAGHIAWHSGPAGKNGSYATNLWTWSLAMNSASKQKLAAWLFIQWATSKQALNNAIKGGAGAFADPVRQSVFDGTFKKTLGAFPGYLETFEKVIDSTKIQFTPQQHFFESTENWAVAVQQIYGGAEAKSTLDALATASTALVNK